MTAMQRKPIAARIGPAADEFITRLATELEVSRADVFRAMLAVASGEQTAVKAKVNEMKKMFG